MACGPTTSKTYGYCKIVGAEGQIYFLGWGQYTKKVKDLPEYKIVDNATLDKILTKVGKKLAGTETFKVYYVWMQEESRLYRMTGKPATYHKDVHRIEIPFSVSRRNSVFNSLYKQFTSAAKQKKVLSTPTITSIFQQQRLATLITDPVLIKNYVGRTIGTKAKTYVEAAVTPLIKKEHDKAKGDLFLYGSVGVASIAFLGYHFTRN